MISTNSRIWCAAVVVGAALACTPAAIAQSPVVAKVNGKILTEADLKLAEAEIGSEIGTLPESTRRRVLVDFLIETQLFADAAEGAKLGQGSAFDERMQYWRRRALRDSYFEHGVKNAVGEADARKLYDTQISQVQPQEEVKARHILVETEAQAKEIYEKIAHGADFAALAKEVSKDPGTKDDGGALGFFSKGQMVPQFEEAAFKLNAGDVSQPVQTQFGWHVIKLDERRQKPLPAFDDLKDRILNSMIYRKAQEVIVALREKADVEYVDAEVKKQVESEKAASQPAPKQ